ncbi:hypothetical protein, partial [Aliiglaciecola sp. NS0011-25]|uniref:hypothetical protein n=1 Tax=Aliiglaciecola sp. NS0011-25 TaxID=3127654 RepID=UPI00333E7622
HTKKSPARAAEQKTMFGRNIEIFNVIIIYTMTAITQGKQGIEKALQVYFLIRKIININLQLG